MPKVAIIGGGIAGLAAACRLVAGGMPVTLFEAAPQLGGRARGIAYQDQMLDNGQHILLGAYRETLQLLKLAGIDETQAFMRLPLQLHMQSLMGERAISIRACSALPAPLHILAAFLLAQGLSLSSKYAALRLMIWAQLHGFTCKKDLPLRDFLTQRKQTPQLISAIWEPLCLAALNTPMAEASTQVFLNVLRDSFARKKADSDMLLPRADLSALLGQPLAAWLGAHGANVQLSTPVKSLEQTNDGFSVQFKNTSDTFSHVILACGPHQLAHLNLPSAIKQTLPSFEYQPITTVYLQFNAATRLPQAMTGMYRSVSQWVFDRGALCGQHGLLAVVISADKNASSLANDALAAQVLAELKQIYPHLGEPNWHKVITEKFATFACKPALTRPAAHTPVKNLLITGDFVANDYPATIEGAVRNGLHAADMLQGLL